MCIYDKLFNCCSCQDPNMKQPMPQGFGPQPSQVSQSAQHWTRSTAVLLSALGLHTPLQGFSKHPHGLRIRCVLRIPYNICHNISIPIGHTEYGKSREEGKGCDPMDLAPWPAAPAASFLNKSCMPLPGHHRQIAFLLSGFQPTSGWACLRGCAKTRY